MIILDIEQRTDAWYQARLGRLTSSGAADVMSFRKDGKESAGRRDYRVQLAAERVTGRPCGSDYRNADMDRGTALEPDAIAAYEAETGAIVMPVGFCQHDALMAGYSPDGFVGDDGLIEVKCPRPANHLANMRGGVVPGDYLPQLRHALWLTGRSWIDFVSYCPAFPDGLQLFVRRHYAYHDLQIEEYQRHVGVFLAEVDREVEAINALRKAAA